MRCPLLDRLSTKRTMTPSVASRYPKCPESDPCVWWIRKVPPCARPKRVRHNTIYVNPSHYTPTHPSPCACFRDLRPWNPDPWPWYSDPLHCHPIIFQYPCQEWIPTRTFVVTVPLLLSASLPTSKSSGCPISSPRTYLFIYWLVRNTVALKRSIEVHSVLFVPIDRAIYRSKTCFWRTSFFILKSSITLRLDADLHCGICPVPYFRVDTRSQFLECSKQRNFSPVQVPQTYQNTQEQKIRYPRIEAASERVSLVRVFEESVFSLSYLGREHTTRLNDLFCLGFVLW